jgi:hypothetical protein
MLFKIFTALFLTFEYILEYFLRVKNAKKEPKAKIPFEKVCKYCKAMTKQWQSNDCNDLAITAIFKQWRAIMKWLWNVVQWSNKCNEKHSFPPNISPSIASNNWKFWSEKFSCFVNPSTVHIRVLWPAAFDRGESPSQFESWGLATLRTSTRMSWLSTSVKKLQSHSTLWLFFNKVKFLLDFHRFIP